MGERQVHDSILKEYMGDKFDVYVPSNAPIGFHFFEYAPEQQKATKAYGEKVGRHMLRLAMALMHVGDHTWSV